MAKSKGGFILSLISGILGILQGIAFLTVSFIIRKLMMALEPETESIGGFSSASGILFTQTNFTLYLIAGIFFILLSGLIILGATWMNNPDKCRKGGILVLVIGIIFLLTLIGVLPAIFAIIGGILGITASKKTTKAVTYNKLGIVLGSCY